MSGHVVEETGTSRGRIALPMRVIPVLLAIAPLVVLPGQVDFAVLPQQVVIQLAALVLALAWLVSGPRWRDPGRLRSLDLAVLAFLAWSGLSLVLSHDRESGLRTLGHWGACAVVYALVSRAARPGDESRLAAGALAGGFALAAIGMAQAFFGLAAIPQVVAPAATMANRNLAAGYLAALLPLSLIGFVSRRWLVPATAPILAFLPFTSSRAAMAAVALQIALFGLLGWAPDAPAARRRRSTLAMAICSGLLLATSLTWWSLDPAKARSVGLRVELTKAALAMGWDQPWLGAGLGRFEALYPAYGPVIRVAGEARQVESAHNEVAQVFAETGLPGLLALAWIALAALGTVNRLRRSGDPRLRRAGVALGLCLVGLGVDGLFGFPLRTALPPLLAAVVLGLLSSLDAARPARVVWGAAAADGVAGRWLARGAGATIAAALALAVSLSLLRVASDHALRSLRSAEAEGRWRDAVDAGWAALALDPRPGVLVAVARAELRLGNHNVAVALLRRALELHPFEPTALATLGVARWAQGDSAGAAALLRVAHLLGAGPARSAGAASPEAIQAPPPGASMAPCATGVALDLLSDRRIDLTADAAPLADVLRCISARAGVRLEFDGPQPTQRVAVKLRGQPVLSVVVSLFEGLGVDYLLTADGSGTGVDRLIVFGSSGRPAGASPRPTLGAPTRAIPPVQAGDPEPSWGDEDRPYSPNDPTAPPMADPYTNVPAIGFPPGSPGADFPAGVTPLPEHSDPQQLSPTVLQLVPRPVLTGRFSSPVRKAPDTLDGT